MGSINLAKLVKFPFLNDAAFDWDTYRKMIKVYSRMLDNVVEINGLPLPEQRGEIFRKRRHGMGYLGLGSALCLMGIKYGSPEAIAFTEEVSKVMAVESWIAGVELAIEKGPAPIMEEDFIITGEMMTINSNLANSQYKIGDTVKGKVLVSLSHYFDEFRADPTLASIVEDIATHGSRYSHATSIAPTGTISLSLCNNASNGIEPSFAHSYTRNVLVPGKKAKQAMEICSYELLLYRALINSKAKAYTTDPDEALPEYFSSSETLTPKQHVDMQAAAQKWIDSSISKTANVPTDYPFEDFKDIYSYAYKKGLKGCFDTDSPVNTVTLATGETISLRQLVNLGEGSMIRTDAFSIGRVDKLFDNGKADVYRYTFSNGTQLDVTTNHVIEVADGRELAIDAVFEEHLEVNAVLPSIDAVDETDITTSVTIVCREYIGERDVMDLRIVTERDDHIYMVNGIRVHNCTTFRFNPEAFQGVLVKDSDLENTVYEFTLSDGSVVSCKGNEDVTYENETYSAANLFDALKEGYYGRI